MIELNPDANSPVTGHGLDCATADMYPHIAKIYYRSDARAHQIFHEVLHIDRAYVLGSEVLYADSSADQLTKENFSEFNNDLDHVHVIPIEVTVYPESSKYWEADFDRKLDELHWLPSTDQQMLIDRTIALLRGWIILSHALPNSATTANYRRHLISHGLLKRADVLTQAIKQAGKNKRAASAALWSALCYNRPELSQFRSYKV